MVGTHYVRMERKQLEDYLELMNDMEVDVLSIPVVCDK